MVSSVETVLQIQKNKKEIKKKESLSPQLPALILFAPPAHQSTPHHCLPEMSSSASRKCRAIPSLQQRSQVPGVPSAFPWVWVPPQHRSRPPTWSTSLVSNSTWVCVPGSRDRHHGFGSCVTTVVDGEGSSGSLSSSRPITYQLQADFKLPFCGLRRLDLFISL